MRSVRAVRTSSAAAALAVLSLLAAGALVPVIPSPSEPVQVRWADNVSDEEKAATAARLRLEQIAVRSDGIWVVNPRDTSTENIRALVLEPRVADTHNIDRRSFRVDPGPSRTLADWAAERSPAFADFRDSSLENLGRPNRWPLILLFTAVLIACITAVRLGNADALVRGVPPMSPHALSAFRIALGTALAAAVAATDIRAIPPELHRSADWLARTPLIRDLASSGTAVGILQPALAATLVLFAAGVVPRVSLAVSAILLTMFTSVMLTRASAHDWSLATVTTWLLLIAPWQHGFGVSNAWRRRRGRPEPPVSNALGVALWIPGVTVGLAFLAAAYAKLDTSGLAWITGGAVRYHFIEDGQSAPVTWGLLVARSDMASVLFALGAIVAESVIWLVIWCRGPATRLVFGMMAAAILTGFYLFQGIAWPAWWVLLLAFLPWTPVVDRVIARVAPVHPLPQPVPPAAVGYVSRPAIAVVGLFVLQQIAVSALRFESEPLVSNFPMYAHTWASRQAFDAHLLASQRRYLLSTDTVSADVLAARLRSLPPSDDVLQETIEQLSTERGDVDVKAPLDIVRRQYRDRFGEQLGTVHVTISERGFDWDRGTYDAQPRLTPLGTLDFDAGVLRKSSGG